MVMMMPRKRQISGMTEPLFQCRFLTRVVLHFDTLPQCSCTEIRTAGGYFKKLRTFAAQFVGQWAASIWWWLRPTLCIAILLITGFQHFHSRFSEPVFLQAAIGFFRDGHFDQFDFKQSFDLLVQLARGHFVAQIFGKVCLA